MTLALTHTFVCGVADDGTPTGGVQPSHWNAALATSMATGKVLGRTTAGTGAIEELGTLGSGSVILSAGTLAIASGKTLTANKSLTLDGTDSTTMTFPTTSATIARTDAAQSFTGVQTFVAPILGTPTSGTLTNCIGLPAAGVVGAAAILGANTFTALQTIAQASANAGIIASTGYSLTGSDTTSMIDLAGTWNVGSATPTAIKLNITNTASGAAAQLLSIGTGGGSYAAQFSVRSDGRTTIGPVGATAFTFGYSGADVYGWNNASGATPTTSNYWLMVRDNNFTILGCRAAAGHVYLALADTVKVDVGQTAVTITDAVNLAVGTTTGTKIGTATTQKLAFWNKTPIVQPTTGITAASFTANTSGIVNDTATFGGYTIGQMAAAMINTGMLA